MCVLGAREGGVGVYDIRKKPYRMTCIERISNDGDGDIDLMGVQNGRLSASP